VVQDASVSERTDPEAGAAGARAGAQARMGAHTPLAGEGLGLCTPRTEADSTHLVKVLGVCAPISVSGSRDQKLAAIAATQRGRVSRRQLRAASFSDGATDRLVSKGRLHRLHTGVYAVGHLAPIPLGAETAALLACREGSALSHLTAATLWKLLRPASTPGADATVDVMIVGAQTARPTGVRVHRTRRLLPHEVRVLERLPVTSPARTLLDSADLLSEYELEWAVNEAQVSRIVRVAELRDVLSRAAGRRGSPLLAKLLEGRREPALTRSEAERRLIALIRSARLPTPSTNVRLHGYSVDALWREQRLVVEVDGFRYHGGRNAFERDRAKGATPTAAGFDVMRVTWRQMEDEAYAVIARLAQALAWAQARRAG